MKITKMPEMYLKRFPANIIINKELETWCRSMYFIALFSCSKSTG